jgi:hypothetical protein
MALSSHMAYITYQGLAQVVAEQMMLQDLEHRFHKSNSSLEKFGFPTPDGVRTELEEAISLWISPDVLARLGQLLDSLNKTHPNNYKQQQAYKSIMELIVNFKDANQDDGMEQANVEHKVMLITLSKGYFCTKFYIRWSPDVTSQSTTTQTTNKHHHHGDGAACPYSGVDLMIPCCPRGGRPCACSF